MVKHPYLLSMETNLFGYVNCKSWIAWFIIKCDWTRCRFFVSS